MPPSGTASTTVARSPRPRGTAPARRRSPARLPFPREAASRRNARSAGPAARGNQGRLRTPRASTRHPRQKRRAGRCAIESRVPSRSLNEYAGAEKRGAAQGNAPGHSTVEEPSLTVGGGGLRRTSDPSAFCVGIRAFLRRAVSCEASQLRKAGLARPGDRGVTPTASLSQPAHHGRTPGPGASLVPHRFSLPVRSLLPGPTAPHGDWLPPSP